MIPPNVRHTCLGCRLMLMVALCPHIAIGRSGGPQGFSGELDQHPTESQVAAFLREVAADRVAQVERDPQGQAVSLVLCRPYASDRGMILASQLRSLRSLTIQGQSMSTGYSEHGASSLHALTNLVTLKILCTGPLDSRFFKEVCRLRSLRELQLTAAMPPSREYRWIADLHRLERLGIANCTNFGDAEISVVTNLVKLKNLQLVNNAVTHHGTNVLKVLPGLTDVLFIK